MYKCRYLIIPNNNNDIVYFTKFNYILYTLLFHLGISKYL